MANSNLAEKQGKQRQKYWELECTGKARYSSV